MRYAFVVGVHAEGGGGKHVRSFAVVEPDSTNRTDVKRNSTSRRRETGNGQDPEWDMPVGAGLQTCVYSRSIRLLRLRILRVLTAGLGPPSSGHGGSSRVGSRSSAPRATMRFRGEADDAGMGGSISGEGPRAPCAVLGRDVEPSGAIRELRLSLFVGALVMGSGAVCGVRGV